jgi:hypothetical protein
MATQIVMDHTGHSRHEFDGDDILKQRNSNSQMQK